MLTTVLLNLLMLLPRGEALEIYSLSVKAWPQQLILPVPEGQRPEEALQAYIAGLSSNSDLQEFAENLRKLETDQIDFRKLNSADSKVLILANRKVDQSEQPARVSLFAEEFAKAGAHSFIFPVAGGIHLNDRDRKDLSKLIGDHFDMVTLLGGDDISPKLYGRYNTYSENVNHSRDEHELELIKDIIKDERAFVLGVCRGHQMVAVSEGMTLVQDIDLMLQSRITHHEGEHPMLLLKTPKSLLRDLIPESAKKLYVNSIHHQAVRLKRSSRLQLAAIASDRTPEAFEFRNGKGVTLQFHPELMESDWAKALLQNAVKKAQSQSAKSCDSLLRAS